MSGLTTVRANLGSTVVVEFAKAQSTVQIRRHTGQPSVQRKVGESMLSPKAIAALIAQPRQVEQSKPHDPALGLLGLLPGTWKSEGHGWT